MGLRSKQDNLEQNRQQQTNLIEQLTTENSNLQEQVQSLESQSSSLQQALQEKQQEVSNLQQENNNLTDKLAEAYRRIENLANSDLELTKAQQLKQSASAELEKSRQLMRDAEQQKQQNEQSKSDLMSSRKTLESQQKGLEERENQLETTLGAYKKQAEKDAAAALADGWKELEKAKDAAEKEQDEARQQAEDLKAEAQRELTEVQNAKAAAQEKGYQDTVNTYTLAIRAMMLFCVVLGLVEVIKHQYIFEVYQSAYISLSDYIGFWLASAVAAVTATIFLAAYFLPLRDSDGLYFGLALRLILLVTLFALADAVPASAAAIIIYLSCIVVGCIRWHK